MAAKAGDLSWAELQAIAAHYGQYKLAGAYVDNWKPVDRSWDVIEGCAYLRLSTDDHQG